MESKSQPLNSFPLVKWDKTYKIFNDEYDMIPPIPNNYVDDEIEGQVSLDQSIFENIENFISGKYRYYFRKVPTLLGNQSGLVKEWIGQSGRLQLWMTTCSPYSDDVDPYIGETSWAVIYGDLETFLIVGNNDSHPFVMTPSFSFDNSDGSTFEDIDFLKLDLEEVKNLVKTKVPEYLFEQIH